MCRPLKFLLLAGFASACGPLANKGGITRDEAVAIARDRATSPSLVGGPEKALEGEKAWLVVLDPAEAEALGGRATLIVDKRSGEVLGAFGEQ